MIDRLEEIYDEWILEHYECPYHRGELPQATCRHAERNPICGDVVELQLQIDDGRVRQAYFTGKGCTISQAAASILCEHIEGKSVEELKQLQAQKVLELLKVPLSPSRQKCGLLPFKVLKTMLYEQERLGTCSTNTAPHES